jgi:hypothetical protein
MKRFKNILLHTDSKAGIYLLLAASVIIQRFEAGQAQHG